MSYVFGVGLVVIGGLKKNQKESDVLVIYNVNRAFGGWFSNDNPCPNFHRGISFNRLLFFFLFFLDELNFTPPVIEEPIKNRYGHTSAVSNSTFIVVFGGKVEEDDETYCTNDVFVLRVKCVNEVFVGKWKKLKCTGIVPLPRYSHSAVCHDDRMFVVGGVAGNGDVLDDIYCLNLNSCVWVR